MTSTGKTGCMSTLGDVPLEQDESEMDMNFNWTGTSVFDIPLLIENVEPETTD